MRNRHNLMACPSRRHYDGLVVRLDGVLRHGCKLFLGCRQNVSCDSFCFCTFRMQLGKQQSHYASRIRISLCCEREWDNSIPVQFFDRCIGCRVPSGFNVHRYGSLGKHGVRPLWQVPVCWVVWATLRLKRLLSTPKLESWSRSVVLRFPSKDFRAALYRWTPRATFSTSLLPPGSRHLP